MLLLDLILGLSLGAIGFHIYERTTISADLFRLFASGILSWICLRPYVAAVVRRWIRIFSQ